MSRLELQRWRELLKAREQSRGLLVAFEGPDGSGKSTQHKLFKSWLKSQGLAEMLTCTCGSATYPDEASSAEGLIEKARGAGALRAHPVQ